MFAVCSSGRPPGQLPVPSTRRRGSHVVPRRLASGSVTAGRPVGGGARPARHRLAPLALPPDDLGAEPRRLLLPGLPVGEGQRSPGRSEGGSGAGGGAAQRLPGHDGSVSDSAGHGAVAVGELQPAGRRR